MKWFKHLTGSLNDSIIYEAIERFGGDGYLVYFGILEMLGAEYKVYNPGEIILSLKKVARNLQLSRQKTVRILSFFDQKAQESLPENKSFFAVIDKDYIMIKCNKFAELADNHTKKIMRETSKPLRSENEVTSLQEEEVEEEVEEDNNNSVLPVSKNIQSTFRTAIKIIIKDLNKRLESTFKENNPNTEYLIFTLWQMGYRVDDFKSVNKFMVEKWKDDERMSQYLRPKTLYDTDKFEGYLAESKRSNGCNGKLPPGAIKEAKIILKIDGKEKCKTFLTNNNMETMEADKWILEHSAIM